MIAQILYTDNLDEIERAEALNLPLPEERYGWYKYHFDIESVHIACINNEGNINVFLPSGKWILKYDEVLWNKIIKCLDQE